MDVVAVPVLSDNYAYLLIDTKNRVAAAVDPAEADKVYAAADKADVKIVCILTTHGHADHAGGNKALVRLLEKDHEKIAVVGRKEDDIPALTKEVTDQEVIQVGALRIQVYHTPCHTRGHVLYHCGNALFTGDTLFIAGCGRFFEGTPAEMDHALNSVIAKLPLDTNIYCGHEYTMANLRFASTVEPDNDAIKKKLNWAKEQTRTIPSTLQDEMDTNPFMRVRVRAVQEYAGHKDPVEVIRVLRDRKNQF